VYMVPHISSRVSKIIANRHFWLVVAMFAIGIVLHYPQQILATDSPSLLSFLGLTRHAMERVFFLLPVTYAGFIFGIKAGLASLAVALVIMLPRVFLISLYLPDALFETSGIIVIGGMVNLWFHVHSRDITHRKSAEKNLRYYLQEITRAQEEERRRIARELHDDTTQDLVVLSRQLDSFVISATNHLPTEDISYLEGLRQQTERILDGVHRFSQDLRPSVLDDLGIVPALEWLTSDLTNHFEVDITLEVRGSERRFPPDTELILFRIAQEALRNIWKHSEASKAWVTVEFGDAKAVLTVKDNGKGFQLPERMGDLAVAGKLGLAGMQERAQLAGGRLTLQSEPSKGTTVIVEVPI